MNSLRVLVLAVAVAVVTSVSAYADGAIAVGKGANPAKNGIAVGLSTDFRTAKAANADAIGQCRRSSNVSASTRSQCKVVATFKNKCAAVAFDPRPGKPGFGWGVGATKWQANAAAVRSCNASGGGGACKAFGNDCD